MATPVEQFRDLLDVGPPRRTVVVRDGRTPVYRDSWFVVHTGTDTPAALLCLQTDENEWDGLWTFDPARVDAIESVASTL